MDLKNKPRLLIVKNLEEIVEDRIIEIKKITNSTLSDFLYSYTLLEGTMWMLLNRIFVAFPEKLCGDNDNETIEIEKSFLLSTNDYYLILSYVIEKKLFKVSKGNMNAYIKFFEKQIGLNLDVDDKLIKDMSLARNVIAHNNAPIYLDEMVYSKLDNPLCSDENRKKYIKYIKDLLVEIKSQISKNYASYTYKKLLLDSWEYTMPKCVSIENVFDFTNGIASIKEDEAKKVAKMISSGERFILQIWLENYSNDVMMRIMKDAGMILNYTHSTMTHKIRFLQEMFSEYPFMVNGRTINFQEDNKEKK